MRLMGRGRPEPDPTHPDESQADEEEAEAEVDGESTTPVAEDKPGDVWAPLVTEVPGLARVVLLENVLGDEDLVHLIGTVGQAQGAGPLVHRGQR